MLSDSLPVRYAIIGAVLLALAAPAGAATIVDHTTADIWQIPEAAIAQAKSALHIAYGHTSHGSQLISGMGQSGGAELDAFMTQNGATPGLYRWNAGGTGGALDLRDHPFVGASDLGSPDRYAWAQSTRNYLATHPECNVIIWSWCGQAATTLDNIDIYLNLMEDLIADYPAVQFVFMTGHLDGTGSGGLLNLANEHIREHCTSHNRILYDFADIESYDPDHLVHYMPLLCTDNCDYDSDGNGSRDRNWAIDWQSSHVEGVDWWPSGAAHSQHLNGNLKGYAAWWLWARLAGWDHVLPAAPSGLVAHGDTVERTVCHTWIEHADHETGFVIQRQIDGGAWNDAYASVAADVVSYLDDNHGGGPLPDGSYTYRVVAMNAHGSSSPSNLATAVIAHSPPDAPTDLASTLDGHDISLTWTDQSDNEESFVLERAVDAGPFGVLAILPAGASSHLDEDPAPAHSYVYRVKARNDFGDSDYSNETTQYVPDEPLSLLLKQGVGGYAGCRDAYLDAQFPTFNYGGDLYNDVENDPKCSLAICFDLPEELLGMTILEARIGFYCWTLSNWQEGQYLDLYQLTEAWTEGSADGAYEPGGASWTVRSGEAGADLFWSTPGGTHDPLPLDRSLIPPQAYYPEFIITTAVQAWADGNRANLGLLLKNDSVTSTGIKASEYSEYGRPYLEISYSYPGAAPSSPVGIAALQLLPSRPNPADGPAGLRFRLDETEMVDLSIFGIDGRRVTTLVHESRDAGEHEVWWDGADDHGTAVRGGIYFVRLESARGAKTIKVVRR